uniref:CASP-like protein n=1 Tax=Oryza rufipogon TaxID=4529 RepID=A0A0E0P5V2_ORYRU
MTVALAAAVILFVCTVLQTVFAALGYKKQCDRVTGSFSSVLLACTVATASLLHCPLWSRLLPQPLRPEPRSSPSATYSTAAHAGADCRRRPQPPPPPPKSTAALAGADFFSSRRWRRGGSRRRRPFPPPPHYTAASPRRRRGGSLRRSSSPAPSRHSTAPAGTVVVPDG